VALATRSNEKRRAILEATIRVLQEQGLRGLKIEDVARAAEIGKGTVYLYFRDKQELLKALVEHRATEFYADAEAIVRQDRSFFERLRDLLERRLAFIDEWRGLWGAVAAEVAQGEAKKAWLTGLHERYHRILSDFVADGMERGELRQDLEPELVGAALSALGCAPQLPVDRGAYLDQLVEIWKKGVGAKP